VSRVPLSDEETYVIFTEKSLAGLQSLDGSKQQQVLQKLLAITESASPPSQLVYEQIGSIDIFAAGGQMRLYTKIVDNIPEDNSTYHFVYVIYIDDTHEYNQADLVEYDPIAVSLAEAAVSLGSVESVDEYLSDKPAFDSDDLSDMLS